MEYLSKGDFSDFIRLNFPLKIDTIQFYAAEIVSFLEYIQSKKIVHRDLKPENIMMNDKWHLEVIDFGTARILGKYFDKENMEFKDDDTTYDISETDDLKGNKIAINEEDDDDFFEDSKSRPERRGMTFVGTAEYVSPEVLGDKPAEFGADVWALGIMIYQMFFGKTPFKEKNNYLTFRKIEQLKIDFGDGEKIKIPDDAKDLISKILVKEPSKRLGGGEPGTEYDIAHLKSHPFFKGIDWKNLHNKTPPNSENFDFLLNKKNKEKKVEENKKTEKNKEPEIKSENKEIILKSGELEKKSPWLHYNTRKIILYSTPKIAYIDPSNNKVKGEIYLDKSVKVNHVSSNVFDIISSKRNFRFKASNGEALVWEKSINEAIKQYGK
jgi:3-phosphoinositide dependent protein kinase-1